MDVLDTAARRVVRLRMPNTDGIHRDGATSATGGQIRETAGTANKASTATLQEQHGPMGAAIDRLMYRSEVVP